MNYRVKGGVYDGLVDGLHTQSALQQPQIYLQ